VCVIFKEFLHLAVIEHCAVVQTLSRQMQDPHQLNVKWKSRAPCKNFV